MLDTLRQTENGVLIDLHLTTNASQTAIGDYDRWKKAFRFKTKELAIKNKANADILDFLSRLFAKEVKLVSGQKSSKKTVLVLGATLEEVSGKLNK